MKISFLKIKYNSEVIKQNTRLTVYRVQMAAIINKNHAQRKKEKEKDRKESRKNEKSRTLRKRCMNCKPEYRRCWHRKKTQHHKPEACSRPTQNPYGWKLKKLPRRSKYRSYSSPGHAFHNNTKNDGTKLSVPTSFMAKRTVQRRKKSVYKVERLLRCTNPHQKRRCEMIFINKDALINSLLLPFISP